MMAAEGVPKAVIAERLDASRSTVLRWRNRFVEDGVDAVGHVRPGRGRKPDIPAATDRRNRRAHPTRDAAGGDALVSAHHGQRGRGGTLHGAQDVAGPEAQDASGRHVQGVERSPLRRQAHRRSRDVPVDPPEHAVVLSVDEKTQVQALDRTQPTLPMKPGRARTMTHDYKRNGTTTLFAALNVLTGEVIDKCLPRHGHQEFLAFLKEINRHVPRGMEIHVVLNNVGTHTRPEVVTWLDKHHRSHLHFTPTSSSLAQPSRALVPRTQHPSPQARQLRQRRRTRRRHRQLDRPSHQRPQTVRVEHDRRQDHRQSPPRRRRHRPRARQIKDTPLAAPTDSQPTNRLRRRDARSSCQGPGRTRPDASRQRAPSSLHRSPGVTVSSGCAGGWSQRGSPGRRRRPTLMQAPTSSTEGPDE